MGVQRTSRRFRSNSPPVLSYPNWLSDRTPSCLDHSRRTEKCLSPKRERQESLSLLSSSSLTTDLESLCQSRKETLSQFSTAKVFAILILVRTNTVQTFSTQCLHHPGSDSSDNKGSSAPVLVNITFKDSQSDNSYIPLWRRFSQQTRTGRYRYTQCSQSQSADFLAWLLWQRQGLPGTPFRHLKPTKRTSHTDWTNRDFIRCRDNLLRTVSHLNAPLDRLLVRVMYVITLALCELDVYEVCAAVRLASAIDFRCNTSTIGDVDVESVMHLLYSNSGLFRINTDKVVKFQDSAMPGFLTGSGLPDFSTGHLLMGHLYLEHVQVTGFHSFLTPWTNFQHWYSNAHEAPFCAYLARYGPEHCRRAQQQQPTFCADIHKVMLKASSTHPATLKREHVLTVEAQRDTIDCCLEASLILEFNELTAAYKEMGAVFDHRHSKILPNCYLSNSTRLSTKILATTGQFRNKNGIQQRLHFQRLKSPTSNNADVNMMCKILKDISLSSNETTTPCESPLKQKAKVFASSMNDSFKIWIDSLQSTHMQNANQIPVSTSQAHRSNCSKSEHSSNSCIGDDSEWELVNPRDVEPTSVSMGRGNQQPP